MADLKSPKVTSKTGQNVYNTFCIQYILKSDSIRNLSAMHLDHILVKYQDVV